MSPALAGYRLRPHTPAPEQAGPGWPGQSPASQNPLGQTLPGHSTPGQAIPERQAPGDVMRQVWPRASVPPAAGTHLRIARRALLPAAESSRAAREFTRATLRDWGLDVLLQDAALVASELVTNALRHGVGCVAADGIASDGAGSASAGGTATGAGGGQGKVELIWWWRVNHLVCVVIDPSTQPPVLKPTHGQASDGLPPDDDVLDGHAGESGRGLHVVQALARVWGWTAISAREKAVWASLLLPAPYPPRPPRRLAASRPPGAGS